MKIGVVYEKLSDKDFPDGYYYAHIPSIGLTTHGKGIEGAKIAIYDLLKLWVDEKLQSLKRCPNWYF
ncbi:MAG: type II toxin-antitoxin system HicB family antitoxin [bacterium]